MPVTESERLALHEQLAEKIGPEPAGTLMNQLPRVDSDELATKTDLRQFGDQLQTEMRGLKSEMRAEMEQRFANLDRRITAVQVDISGLAREFTDKMARQSRNLILAMLAMTVPIWASLLVAVLVTVLSGSTA